MDMAMLIGISFPNELSSGIGHVACTLGGVNYESRGGRGCLKGSAARGATNALFKHRFHRILTMDEAAMGKEYADVCAGQPYVWGGVPGPNMGGDCSGYMSGIICAAQGDPVRRLFGTGTWSSASAGLGFAGGLDGGGARTDFVVGVADRPFPGFAIEKGSKKADHVMWIQARLDFAAGGKHEVLQGKALDVDGDFGGDTLKVVKAFQIGNGLQGLGMVGPQTWKLLNSVR